MRSRGAGWLSVVLGTLIAAAAARPAVAADSPIDTTLSLRADGWSGDRDLDDRGALARASAWGRAKADLGDRGDLGRVVGDGWLASQSNGDAAHGRLRELYWQGRLGPIDAKLGRQLVVWGRADGLNPTDNLTPRDFTLLVTDDNDQRRGNEAAQLGVDIGAGTLRLLWFPRAASHRLPLEALPQVVYDIADPPHRAQWAAKFEVAGDGIDGSVSYFAGDDPLPDLALLGADAAGVHIGVRNHPLQVLGADLSATRGDVVWRAEAAWMRGAGSDADDFSRKKPRLWLVAGAEWPLAEHLTLGLQATLQQVQGFRSPDLIADPLEREIAWRQAAISNQTSAHQAGLIWRIGGRWLNDALTAEFSGVRLGQPGSTLRRARLSYAIDDRLQIRAGTDQASGPAHSLWGQLRRNRVGFVQLRFGF